jgi:hypothetical protein
MAYNEIPQTSIDGAAIPRITFGQYSRDNFIQHQTSIGSLDTRVGTLEAAQGITPPVLVHGVWANGTLNIDINGANENQRILLWTITISDPGWPYIPRIHCSVPVSWNSDGFGFLWAVHGSLSSGTVFFRQEMSRWPHGWSAVTIPGATMGNSLTGAQTIRIGASANNGQAIARTAQPYNRFCYAELLLAAA